MGSFRLRFTTRSLMLVVLLVGLNLAAALATSSDYPRQQLMLGALNNLGAPYIGFPDEHGLTYTYRSAGFRQTGMADGRSKTRMADVRVEA